MHFLKNVFITLFFVATTSISYQLNAMKSKAMTAMLEEIVASDFQIYQLLSAATKDNIECYLPDEVTQIIALNAYEITELRCYEEYGACVVSPDGCPLKFIYDSLGNCMGHTEIVNILRTCLRYCGKSLAEIKCFQNRTVLHRIIQVKGFFCLIRSKKFDTNTLRLDCIKIILRAAGDKAWDLIKMEDDLGFTILHQSSCSSTAILNELLSVAPCPEELWKLACVRTDLDDIVLHALATEPFTAEAIKRLLSSAPSSEKAWWLINERNRYGETALSLATKQGDEEVIEILESYRPKEQ